ncbi:MAG: hypothetical protein ACI845_000692 [Gammaproteobacteria bacterium]|jgi:hypothetical protein
MAFSVSTDIKEMDIMTDAEFTLAVELYQELCRVMLTLEKRSMQPLISLHWVMAWRLL